MGEEGQLSELKKRISKGNGNGLNDVDNRKGKRKCKRDENKVKKGLGTSRKTRRNQIKEIKNEEKRKRKNEIKIGNWNVQSSTGKEEELVEEMIQHDIEILAITETKKKGKGLKKIHKGYWLLWTGVNEKERAKEGVGLIIAPNKLKDLIQEEFINERLLTVKIKLIDEEIWTVIVAYGENENARKEEKDKFFDELQKQIDEGEENVMIIGDLNGRVGNKNSGIEKYMGKEGEETLNKNGKRIIEICIENNLIITNTKFKHKDIHKYTRGRESRNEKSIIDYFLISKNKWK